MRGLVREYLQGTLRIKAMLLLATATGALIPAIDEEIYWNVATLVATACP